jgi:hypothetical protein
MDLTSLLKGFAAEARLGEVYQNALGGSVLELRTGGKVIIEPTENREWAFLTGILCPVPEENGTRLSLFEGLLKAHGRNAAKQGFCFAWSPVVERVVLSQRLFLPAVDQNGFNTALVEFLHSYLYWRDEVMSGRLQEAVPDSDPMSFRPSPGTMLRL